MDRPPKLPISEDDWNQTPLAVQAVVVSLWQQVGVLQAQIGALLVALVVGVAAVGLVASMATSIPAPVPRIPTVGPTLLPTTIPVQPALPTIFPPLATPVPPASGGTVVKISPVTSQIAVDETVTINVQVESVADLAVVEMRLAYNPTILEVIAITEGSFFTPEPGTLTKRDMIGIVRYEAKAMQPTNGSGTLVSIECKGLSAGTTYLAFALVFLGNTQGGAISSTNQGGQIIVEAASD